MNIYITDGTPESFYTAVFTACTDKDCIASLRNDFLCHLLPLFLTACGQHDFHSIGGKRTCNRFANASACTGHNGNFALYAFESSFHSIFPFALPSLCFYPGTLFRNCALTCALFTGLPSIQLR